MNLIVILLLTLFVTSIIYTSKTNKMYEGYWDLIPYKYHYNIFKCFDLECLEREEKKCCEACYNISAMSNSGLMSGVGKCKVRCRRATNQQAMQLGFNDYTFSYALPRFKKYALFNLEEVTN